MFSLTQLATTPPIQLSIWEKYGLPGLVIGALFICLVMLFRALTQERKDANEALKSATDSYRSDVAKMSESTNETAKELTGKFVDLHREQAEAFKDLHQRTLDQLTKSGHRE